MRILIKWCEELEKNLEIKNLYEREEPFRMSDGSEEFIPISDLEDPLEKHLNEKKDEVKKYREELLENNY